MKLKFNAKLDPTFMPMSVVYRDFVAEATSAGGEIILESANQVINQEFPDLAKKCQLHIPDEKARRVGQSVAAASLPKIK